MGGWSSPRGVQPSSVVPSYRQGPGVHMQNGSGDSPMGGLASGVPPLQTQGSGGHMQTGVAPQPMGGALSAMPHQQRHESGGQMHTPPMGSASFAMSPSPPPSNQIVPKHHASNYFSPTGMPLSSPQGESNFASTQQQHLTPATGLQGPSSRPPAGHTTQQMIAASSHGAASSESPQAKPAADKAGKVSRLPLGLVVTAEPGIIVQALTALGQPICAKMQKRQVISPSSLVA